MNYNEFKDTVMQHLREYYPEDCYDVSIRKVTKNNGMILDGLCIFPEGINTSPTIYLENYYEKYKKGAILTDILESIQEEYHCGMKLAPSFYPVDSCYEAIKNQLILRLVNYEKNAEILQECPYIRFHDLAITFRWLAHQDDIGISTALVTYHDIERWGINKTQLFQDASRNTYRIFPPKIARLKELVMEEGLHLADEQTELFVLTNEQGMNGATCILYHHMLEKISKAVGGSYYLLPSSIHEMMICPEDEKITPDILLSLVKEANHMVVTMGEVLSDNIYYYNKEQKILSFIKQPISNS